MLGEIDETAGMQLLFYRQRCKIKPLEEKYLNLQSRGPKVSVVLI